MYTFKDITAIDNNYAIRLNDGQATKKLFKKLGSGHYFWINGKRIKSTDASLFDKDSKSLWRAGSCIIISGGVAYLSTCYEQEYQSERRRLIINADSIEYSQKKAKK